MQIQKDIIEALIVGLPFSILLISLVALGSHFPHVRYKYPFLDPAIIKKYYWFLVFAFYIILVLIVIGIDIGFNNNIIKIPPSYYLRTK
jgi:hypothetical protein